MQGRTSGGAGGGGEGVHDAQACSNVRCRAACVRWWFARWQLVAGDCYCSSSFKNYAAAVAPGALEARTVNARGCTGNACKCRLHTRDTRIRRTHLRCARGRRDLDDRREDSRAAPVARPARPAGLIYAVPAYDLSSYARNISTMRAGTFHEGSVASINRAMPKTYW